jgi:glycosidase
MKKKNMSLIGVFGLLLLVLAIGLIACQPRKVSEEQEVKVRPVSTVVTPEWAKDATIYEVNTRQFTASGTFDSIVPHLSRLKALGVDILWFMPVHPIGKLNRKEGLGSYYSVQDYKGINPEFGTIEDFKMLVDSAHKLGFKVIIDWVANHTAFDHQWVTDHPEWYKRDKDSKIVSPYDWTDVAQLNFETNPPLWDAMIGDMKYWLTDANIDGFRCDVAGMVPVAFWEKARTELDGIKPVFMLAEDEGTPALMTKAFDANYGWEFHHILNKIAKGEKNANDVFAFFVKNDSLFPANSFRMNFTSNHDENSWNGTEFERMGAAVKAMAVLGFTVPGFPLIYNGQEVALDHRLKFFVKDEIDWTKESDFTAFYQKLNEIKADNPALWNGGFGGDFQRVDVSNSEKVLVFTRTKGISKILVLINLTGEEQETGLKGKEASGSYTNLFTGEKVLLNSSNSVAMPAWSYMILK